MKKNRLYNLLSLIANLSIIYFTVDANLYNFRKDIIRNELVFGFGGVKSFCFFTVLSNLFLAISCAITLFFNVKAALSDDFVLPKRIYKIKFAATAAVSVTMLTVIFFLAPLSAFSGNGYFALFTANNFYLHFLSPLIAVITFIFFEKSDGLTKKEVWLGVIPTALYSVLYITMVVIVGEANGGWPDFYGFTFGGKLYLTPISVIGILGATYLISFALYSLSGQKNKSAH